MPDEKAVRIGRGFRKLARAVVQASEMDHSAAIGMTVVGEDGDAFVCLQGMPPDILPTLWVRLGVHIVVALKYTSEKSGISRGELVDRMVRHFIESIESE